MRQAIILMALLAIVTGSAVYAHRGDPKLSQSVKPYRGPGMRLGSGGGGASLGGPFDSDGIQLLAWMSLDEFGTGIDNGNDCWGYTSPSGREYAIFCHYSGTSFVEISDPLNPVIVETIDGLDSLWRDPKVYQDYCYVVTEASGSGLQVIDMSDIDNGNVSLVNTVTTGGSTDTHNVAIDTDSGFLYRCGGASTDGLRIYDLSDPANPDYVTAWSDIYVHDAQIVTYDSGPYAGQQIAFCCGGLNGGWSMTGLYVVDVTNKSNIFLRDSDVYPNGEYSHQGWLSDDKQYFYLNDELDEPNLGVPTLTKVFDVSNLDNIFEAAEFTNDLPAVGHNMYAKGNLLFEANYRSGLRVFDISNPTVGTEVAYFDTYPTSDSADFNGLWSVYPYFPSGLVIGSDRDRGLFIWALGEQPLGFEYPNGLPGLVSPSGATLQVEIVNQSGIYQNGSAQFFYDTGSGFVPGMLNSLGGQLFEAVFPPLNCAQSVKFYLRAETTDDTVVTDPAFSPPNFHSAVAGDGEIVAFTDSMESGTNGWTVGGPGDDASAGIWVRGDPIGTDAQPEDDHTDPAGTQCWFTGQGTAGGAVGEADVDNGQTTLTSPNLLLGSTDNARISYWRWFSNNQNAAVDDVFLIDISNNGGSTWTNVETIGPTGVGSAGGWIFHEFAVADFVTPTDQIRVRFIASDEGDGSIVECAIDDFKAFDIDCPVCDPWVRGDVTGDDLMTLPDAIGVLQIIFLGAPIPVPEDRADVDNDDLLTLLDGIYSLAYLFQQGPEPAAPFPAPGCE